MVFEPRTQFYKRHFSYAEAGVEDDIHRLWHLITETAKNTDRDDLAHDTLV